MSEMSANGWSADQIAAALNDPGTPAEVLASVAQWHPEYDEAVLAHPQAYDGLRDWIASRAPTSAALAAEPAVSETTARPTIPRPVKIAIAAAAAVVVLGGVGAAIAVSIPRSPEPVAAPVVEDEPDEAPTPTPTVDPGFGAMTAEIGNTVASTGPHVVAATGIGTAGSFQLYGSASAAPVTITYVPSGVQEVTSAFVGVQQLTDHEPDAAVLVSLTTPAQGLQPASTACAVAVFTAEGALAHRYDLPTCYSSLQLAGDVVLLAKDEQDVDYNPVGSVTAIDSTTGATLWTQQAGGHDVPQAAMTCGGGVAGAILGEMEVTDAGTVIFTGNAEMVAVDYTTGQRMWGAVMDRCYEGYFLPTNVDEIGFLAYNGTTYFDTRTGVELAPDQTSGAVDPITGTLSVSNVYAEYSSLNTGNSPFAFETIDKNGAVLYSLASADGLALKNLEVLAAYDGKVWIWTPQGLDIISATTGKKDPSAPIGHEGIQFGKNIPKDAGVNWVIMTDTNGFGELGDSKTIIWSSEPLTYSDLPPTTIG